MHIHIYSSLWIPLGSANLCCHEKDGPAAKPEAGDTAVVRHFVLTVCGLKKIAVHKKIDEWVCEPVVCRGN